MDKKSSRPTLKPENEVEGIGAKSVSDGDAQSVRSARSAPSPRSNRCPSVLAINSVNHFFIFKIQLHSYQGIKENL